MKKNIEWLKSEILELSIKARHKENNQREWHMGHVMALFDVNKLIDQLDEPETLSEEWIENHTVSADTISYYSEDSVPVVTVSNLKGLLVPNQEKPVIPQFVAEWFENDKRDMEIEDVFWQIGNCGMLKLGVDRWISDNRNTFIRAWLDGYEVEKEKLYHVVNKENYFMLRKYDGLVDILYISPSMSRDEYGKDTRFMLTEKEIKEYDERYWAFAEEVVE